MYPVPGPLVFLSNLLADVLGVVVGEHQFRAEYLAEALVDLQLGVGRVAGGGRTGVRGLVSPVFPLPLVVVLRLMPAVQSIKETLLMFVVGALASWGPSSRYATFRRRPSRYGQRQCPTP